MSTWLPEVAAADGESEFDTVFGLRPDLFDAYRDFESVFWTHGLLDAEILDACRSRCAQVLRADGAAAEPVTADDPTSALAACLELAEQFVIDPHRVTTEMRDAVVAHVGDAGLVALVEALAVFDGFTRFCTILGTT
jgi:alkylhydroperoxidase family enzyme